MLVTYCDWKEKRAGHRDFITSEAQLILMQSGSLQIEDVSNMSKTSHQRNVKIVKIL